MNFLPMKISSYHQLSGTGLYHDPSRLKFKINPGSILAWVAQKSLWQNNTAGLEIAWVPTIQHRSELEHSLVYDATDNRWVPRGF